MNRCAKLSSGLAHGDLRKQEADEKGFTASFVVTILNNILSDVAPERAEKLAMKVRTIGIWVSGLLASAIIGGFIGSLFQGPYDSGELLWGALAGILVFTCARLWMTSTGKS